jgi:hypothetical protein
MLAMHDRPLSIVKRKVQFISESTPNALLIRNHVQLCVDLQVRLCIVGSYIYLTGMGNQLRRLHFSQAPAAAASSAASISNNTC